MSLSNADSHNGIGGIVTELVERLDELEAQNQRLRDRVDDLEKRLEDQDVRDDALSTKIDSTKDDVEARIEDIEGRVSAIGGSDPRGMDGENGVRDGEDDDDREDDPTTPLEIITRLPEHVVQTELTANQERARFIAKDVTDYADATPKGLVVSSRTVSRVLRAREDETPHTETISRVMDFLDELGKEDVVCKMHKGRRIAVFDEDVAERYGEGHVAPSQCGVISSRALG